MELKPYVYKDIVDDEDEITLPAGKLYPYEHLERAAALEQMPTAPPPPPSETRPIANSFFAGLWVPLRKR